MKGLRSLKSIFFTIFLVTLFALSQLASAAFNIDASKVKELNSVKQSLKEKENKVKKLSQKISKLESSLGENNDKYVKVIKLKQQVEGEIYSVRRSVKNSQKSIDRKIQNMEKALTGILLNQLSKDSAPSQLLSKKILLKELKKEIQHLEREKKRYQKVSDKLKSLKQRFAEYRSIETELARLLRKMERRKKAKATEYVKSKKTKERLVSEYETLKTKFALNKTKEEKSARKAVGNIDFSAPLKKIVGMEHKKKGVTFKYRGRKPVLSTAKGNVVYRGKLSTYGNLVMIDHGKDTRSVLLGEFSPSVQKGKTVAKGDILGYTHTSKKDGKLYFEVRKHNEAQNTILLLDRKRLLAKVGN